MFNLDVVSEGVFEQKVHVLRGGEELSKQSVQSFIFQSLLLSKVRIFREQGRGDVAHGASCWEGSQMIEEILQLVHLGDGEHPVECDGMIRAALGAVRRQVERVPPVPFKQRHSSGK